MAHTADAHRRAAAPLDNHDDERSHPGLFLRSAQLSGRPLCAQRRVRLALWRAPGGKSGGCSRFVRERQANGENRSRVLRRLHRHRATMADHDLAHDEQPQAQTGL